MLAEEGVTAMEDSVGVFAVTVMEAVPLTPLWDAVTVVEPAATAVTRPLEFTVAMPEPAVTQVTFDVISAVEASVYVAVAVNCCVAPTPRLEVAGETAIVFRVLTGGGSEFADPQPATATANRAAIIMEQKPRTNGRCRLIEPREDSGAGMLIGQAGSDCVRSVERKRRRDLLWRPAWTIVHRARPIRSGVW